MFVLTKVDYSQGYFRIASSKYDSCLAHRHLLINVSLSANKVYLCEGEDVTGCRLRLQ